MKADINYICFKWLALWKTRILALAAIFCFLVSSKDSFAFGGQDGGGGNFSVSQDDQSLIDEETFFVHLTLASLKIDLTKLINVSPDSEIVGASDEFLKQVRRSHIRIVTDDLCLEGSVGPCRAADAINHYRTGEILINVHRAKILSLKNLQTLLIHEHLGLAREDDARHESRFAEESFEYPYSSRLVKFATSHYIPDPTQTISELRMNQIQDLTTNAKGGCLFPEQIKQLAPYALDERNVYTFCIPREWSGDLITAEIVDVASDSNLFLPNFSQDKPIDSKTENLNSKNKIEFSLSENSKMLVMKSTFNSDMSQFGVSVDQLYFPVHVSDFSIYTSDIVPARTVILKIRSFTHPSPRFYRINVSPYIDPISHQYDLKIIFGLEKKN